MAEQYAYIRLDDALQVPGHNVNCWGIIRHVEPPKATRGTDYLMIISLVDTTTDRLEHLRSYGVEVRMWAPEKIIRTAFPTGASHNDIIRFHRIKVKQYEGKTFLDIRVPHNALGSSWVLWSGEPGASEVPMAKSSNTFTFTEADRKRLHALRAYRVARAQAGGAAAGLPAPGPGAPPPPAGQEDAYLRTIYNIVPDARGGGFCDLVCKVIAVDGRQEHMALYIWDGSETLPLPTNITTLEDPHQLLRRYDYPLQAEDHLAVVPLDEFPGLGSIVPVLDSKGSLRAAGAGGVPQPGQWVRLRNVGVAVIQGQIQLLYTDRSRWRPSDPAANEVRHVLEMYEEQIIAKRWVSSRAPTNPEALLTRADIPRELATFPPVDPDIPPRTSIREMLIHNTVVEEPSRKYFVVLARCLDVTPWEEALEPRARYERAMFEGRPAAADPNFLVLSLVLEDGTAQIKATLSSPFAERLLGLSRPSQLREEGGAGAREFLSRMQWSNEGDWTKPWTQPWLELCIMAQKVQQVDPSTREAAVGWAYLVVKTRQADPKASPQPHAYQDRGARAGWGRGAAAANAAAAGPGPSPNGQPRGGAAAGAPRPAAAAAAAAAAGGGRTAPHRWEQDDMDPIVFGSLGDG